jgi:hypothetical protein
MAILVGLSVLTVVSEVGDSLRKVDTSYTSRVSGVVELLRGLSSIQYHTTMPKLSALSAKHLKWVSLT